METKKIVKQQFRIAQTGRSAIARMKRWFYANFYVPVAKQNKEQAEKNKNEWANLSRTLVEYMNENGLSESPVRISLTYLTDDSSSFLPIEVEVERLEIKVLEKDKIVFANVDIKVKKEELTQLQKQEEEEEEEQ